MKIKLEIAEDKHIDFIWKLRNEPAVRRVSLNTLPIPLDEHQKWFAEKKSSDKCTIFVIVADKMRPIGQVRLDALSASTAEISIALVKQQRGNNYGLQAIKLALLEAKKQNFEKVKARIKSFNIASLKAFAAAGFIQLKAEKIEKNVTLIEMSKKL